MDDAAQAFLKTKIMDNIQKYFYLIVFAGYMREQAAAAREAIEADKKAAVALPASGKCSIPATELKVGRTFSDFMGENGALRTLIDTGKGNLQWRETFLQQLLLTLRVLPPRISRATLARLSTISTRLLMSCLVICHRVTTRRESSTGLHPRPSWGSCPLLRRQRLRVLLLPTP